MVDVVNVSPFEHAVFDKATTRGRHFDVILMTGTFAIEHGQPMYPLQEQLAPVTADRYVGGPTDSALLEETHLVVAKRCTDVVLLGSARAPDGQAAARWPIGILVGPVRHVAIVTGPRHWEWSLIKGWHLTPPAPATAVALHAGLAYGGCRRRRSYDGPPTADIHDAAAFDAYAPNPVGLGYAGRQPLPHDQALPAAQIEAPDALVGPGGIGREFAPVCFGPVARWQRSRLALAGRFDDEWRQVHFPYLPPDFDPVYYQCAQPELRAPGFLQGHEPIRLFNCLGRQQVDTQLPGLRMLAMLTDEAGHRQPEPVALDTVTIDLDHERAQLVWRRAVPKSWRLRRVVLAAVPDGPARRGEPAPIHLHPHLGR